MTLLWVDSLSRYHDEYFEFVMIEGVLQNKESNVPPVPFSFPIALESHPLLDTNACGVCRVNDTVLKGKQVRI